MIVAKPNDITAVMRALFVMISPVFLQYRRNLLGLHSSTGSKIIQLGNRVNIKITLQKVVMALARNRSEPTNSITKETLSRLVNGRNHMRTRILIPTILILLSLTACNAPSPPSVEQEVPTIFIPQPEPVQPTAQSTQATTSQSVQEAAPEVETAPPNCLGDEVSPIGKSIAEEYDSVDYDQVMLWFCNGAEFEDILVALETESQTDTPAEDILQMLADGFSWEEIWQVIGLTE